MGNGYLRRLLVVGAISVIWRAETTNTPTGAWIRSLLERKPTRLVTVAIANKTARTAWALLAKGESYKAVTTIQPKEQHTRRFMGPKRDARANVSDDDRTEPLPGHPKMLSGLTSSVV